jgi:hypothetical protein
VLLPTRQTPQGPLVGCWQTAGMAPLRCHMPNTLRHTCNSRLLQQHPAKVEEGYQKSVCRSLFEYFNGNLRLTIPMLPTSRYRGTKTACAILDALIIGQAVLPVPGSSDSTACRQQQQQQQQQNLTTDWTAGSFVVCCPQSCWESFRRTASDCILLNNAKDCESRSAF